MSAPIRSVADRVIALIPWVTASTLLVAVGLMHHRMEQQASAYEAFRTRVSDRHARLTSLRLNAIQVGDRLPSVPLLGVRGVEGFDDLTKRGYRYLYLYRTDCRGCADLSPVWDHVMPTAVGKVAYIAYRPGVDLPVETGADHFAVQGAQAKQIALLTEFVPAMIVLREDGYVIGVADGFSAMLRQLRLNRVVDTGVLDELAARRDGAAPQGTPLGGSE